MAATTEDSKPQPFDSACIGSSAKEGADVEGPDGYVGVFPNPWYFPPCEGGRCSGRLALAPPSDAKYRSFAVRRSYPASVKEGEGELEFCRSGEGEPIARLAARDLRRPCAEEGREGGSTEGAEGDQSRPSTSAASYTCVSLIILPFSQNRVLALSRYWVAAQQLYFSLRLIPSRYPPCSEGV